MQTSRDPSGAAEARLREENSGLWFSPTPEAPTAARLPDARRTDSVLFDLAKVATAAPVAAPPTARGSGLIDVRTLTAAARDPSGAPAPAVASAAMLPSLVDPRAVATTVPVVVEGSRTMLVAIVGLLATLVALLGWLAVA